ncbi:MAG: hypothetical protein ABI614_24830 [Planctomycetota bacterium]
MKRVHGRQTFQSRELKEDSHIGLELFVENEGGKPVLAAKIVFWDAVGQYVVETFGEIPLTVLEALIIETKIFVKVP